MPAKTQAESRAEKPEGSSARSEAENPAESHAAKPTLFTDVVVIGAGQAGLSTAFHLRRRGLKPGSAETSPTGGPPGFVVLDANPEPGGAWRGRWPSLTLSTVNRIHDLPGMPFAEVVGTRHDDGHVEPEQVQARVAVPEYFAAYERRFDLKVRRPVDVISVHDDGVGLRVVTNQGEYLASGLVNATGTWNKPYVPHYPGAERFEGRQLHTRDYKSAEEFIGQHVTVVGAGISAVQLLDEVSQVTSTTWVSRRPPDFREGPFDDVAGRRAVAQVDERVRQGLEPLSVVSVTGLPVTPRIEAMRERGVLVRRPMFSEILPRAVKWPDGTVQETDVILWCTGFRFDLDHLEPLLHREPTGGITMTGRLATQVASDPRVHLVGYGPSASTIGANRAGGAAASELLQYLDLLPS